MAQTRQDSTSHPGCPVCGRAKEQDASFCGGCGHQYCDSTCERCGRAVQRDDNFCPGCGKRLLEDEPLVFHPSRASSHPSPLEFTPEHLAEQILRLRGTIEGERKQATILCADIVDSTRLTYGRGAEEAYDLLAPALEVMRSCVFNYEGYVRSTGDGVHAYFGLPLAHEDHAVRGCYAALDILKRVAELNRTMARPQGQFVEVRIGINSGEVLVKSIQDDLMLEIEAKGPTVALAARMEEMASPGTARLTGNTFELVDGFVETDSNGWVSVKGIADKIRVYELLGARDTPSRFHAIAFRRVLTPFVGRELEIRTLVDAWEAASSPADAHGQVVGLVGEPGAGKSRIVWEFLHGEHLSRALVLQVSSVSHGKATPYLPLVKFVTVYFGIEVTDDDQRRRDKVVRRLSTLDESLIATRSAFFSLLECGGTDASWDALEPSRKRERTLRALVQVILSEARKQAVCLVFEDLHWVDSATQSFLDGLSDALATSRVMLLVNYRPEYDCPWTKKTYFRQVPVEPLSRKDMARLTDALLGPDESLTSVKQHLIDLADGNPFFVEESVQLLQSTAAVVGEPGRFRLERAVSEVEIPATIQATLAARIDRLDPDHKALLHYAAVIGRDIAFPLLQRVMGLQDDVLRAQLARLQAEEFLYQNKLFPELEFTFKHALTSQVAYQTLTVRRQRVMHAEVFESLESLVGDRWREAVERLTHHALRGQVWDKAVRYAAEAGRKTFARSALRDAASYFEQALSALQHLEHDRDWFEQSIDVRLAMRNTLIQLGEVERISRILDDAEPFVRALGDPRRAGVFAAARNNDAYVSGDPRTAVTLGEEALAIAEKLNDFPLRIEMAFRLGQTYFALARFRDAIAATERGIEALGEEHEQNLFGLAGLPSVVCRTWLCQSLAELGDFAQGIARGKEAVKIANQSESPLSLVFAHWGLGHVLLRQGDFRHAADTFERGLDVVRQWPLKVWFPRLASSVGIAKAAAGETDVALELVEEALRTAHEMEFRVDESRLVERQAFVYFQLGRWDDAHEAAVRALDLARQRTEPGHEAWALQLLGRLHACDPRFDALIATDYFQQALALATRPEMRPLAARATRGIGEVQVRAGDAPDGEATLAAASVMFRELDMVEPAA